MDKAVPVMARPCASGQRKQVNIRPGSQVRQRPAPCAVHSRPSPEWCRNSGRAADFRKAVETNRTISRFDPYALWADRPRISDKYSRQRSTTHPVLDELW